MPARKRDPKIDEAVAFLPANGSTVNYSAWVDAMRAAGRFDLVRLIHVARRTGDVVFEIADMNDPQGTHTVRRAAAAAPGAAPVVSSPLPRTPGA